MADVVVTATLGSGGHHGQDRLEPVERLDLGLLIHAENDGTLWGIEVETDHVAHLLDEQRVG